jgi:hypothetical protein
MQSKSLQALQDHWRKHATRAKTDIDWLGQKVKWEWIAEQVEHERSRLRILLLDKQKDIIPAVGISLPDGLESLILGLALALEGIPQAILPFHALAGEQTALSRRFKLTHLFGEAKPPATQSWEWIGSSGQGISCWRCLEATQDDLGKEDGYRGSGLRVAEEGAILLMGTTSGTTSGRPGLIQLNSQRVLDLVLEKRWSPYSLITRPLLGPGMQNWSSRTMKLLHLLKGKNFVVRDVSEGLLCKQIPDDCDGSFATPSLLRKELAKGNLQRHRPGFLIISGADRIPMDLRQVISQTTCIQLGVTYATSQTGPLTWLPPEALLDETDSVGWPLPDVTIQPLVTDNKLEKNGLSFTEAWISTSNKSLNPGDLLSVSKSGQVIFGGRANDVFLFNSILISPNEIEDVLRQHPGVTDCAAFGAHSKRFGSVPMAAITTRQHWDSNEIVHELDKLCKQHLGIRRPQKFIITSNIPKGPTGKTLRRELSNANSLKQ